MNRSDNLISISVFRQNNSIIYNQQMLKSPQSKSKMNIADN